MISHTLRFKVSRVRDTFKPAVPAHHSRASSTTPVLRARGLSPRVRGNRCVIMTQLGKRRRCACTPDCGTTTTCLAGCRTPCTSGATAPYSRLIAS